MNAPTYIFSFITGLFSVLSPCVLPIIPIIVTGRENDSKLRPLLIVFGLGITFISMGILSTLFGHFITPYIGSMEKISGVIVIIFGILFLFDINLFKNFNLFNKLNYNGKGVFSGIILGMTLGLIWIPCVGAVLSSILAMVASSPDFSKGIILLTFYTLGFSIPLLIASYSAHLFREKINFIKSRPTSIRFASGIILILFGIYILAWGMIGFSI